MNKMKYIRRILSVMLVSVLTGTMVFSVYGESLSEAKDKKAKLEQSLTQAEALIDELSSSQDAAEDKITELNKQLSDISNQITTLQNQLADKNQQILVSQDAVNAARETVNAQYAEMKKRIQFMYENGQTTVLEMMLTSGSLADFVNMAEYFSRVTAYDRDKLTEYESSVADLSNAEETLQKEYEELQAMKEEVEQDQEAVASMLSRKESELASISGNLDEAEQLAQSYEAEVQAQNEVLAAIQAAEAERLAQEAAEAAARKEEEEKQAQQTADAGNASSGNTTTNTSGSGNNSSSSTENNNAASGNSSGNTSGGSSSGSTSGSGNSSTAPTGAFVWPVPASRVISSDYGYREVPIAGAGANHNGIDIAAPYGSSVLAAADGKVITSRLSTTAGNMIIIDHGGGVYSVYMHNSARLVSVGDRVTAGQTIAQVGSTGLSTGNHLHFGVSVNGVYVNPWNYLR